MKSLLSLLLVVLFCVVAEAQVYYETVCENGICRQTIHNSAQRVANLTAPRTVISPVMMTQPVVVNDYIIDEEVVQPETVVVEPEPVLTYSYTTEIISPMNFERPRIFRGTFRAFFSRVANWRMNRVMQRSFRFRLFR